MNSSTIDIFPSKQQGQLSCWYGLAQLWIRYCPSDFDAFGIVQSIEQTSLGSKLVMCPINDL
jgi:hypothetical protein